MPADSIAAAERENLLQQVAGFASRPGYLPPEPAPLRVQPVVVVVPAERDPELPLTRQQRDVVAEIHGIADEIIGQFGNRLHELASALALQGIGGVESATLRAIVHACSHARYQAEYRLCQDECARTRIKMNSPLYRKEAPRLAA